MAQGVTTIRNAKAATILPLRINLIEGVLVDLVTAIARITITGKDTATTNPTSRVKQRRPINPPSVRNQHNLGLAQKMMRLYRRNKTVEKIKENNRSLWAKCARLTKFGLNKIKHCSNVLLAPNRTAIDREKRLIMKTRKH